MVTTSIIVQIARGYRKSVRLWSAVSFHDQFMMSESEESIIFKGVIDRFKGVTVSSKDEPCDVEIFPKKLEESLKKWTESKIRGVWFKVALQHSDWVPVLAKNGFIFHHAKSDFVMMNRWLPNEPCNIPNYAHTMIGVGAVVVNEANELLVVREKYYLVQHWKLPGGYVEPDEDITEAAVREVREETSIETKFQSLIAFRHIHGFMFGCSDIYFIAHLIPLSGNITKCDREIAACEWMKIEDFLINPGVHETNRFFVRKFVECQKEGTFITCKKENHPILKSAMHIFSINMEDPKTE